MFDANLKVMKTQTDTYIKLMKEATKSSAEFITKVKDDETFGRLTHVLLDIARNLLSVCREPAVANILANPCRVRRRFEIQPAPCGAE